MFPVFSGLFFYLVNYSLLPYTDENILDIRSLLVVSVVFILAFVNIFAFFHLLIDKFFFKKFYEKPKVLVSVRRGVLLGVLFVGLAWLRIFGYWQWLIISVLVVLAVLFEALFLSLSSSVKGVSRKNAKEKDDS